MKYLWFRHIPIKRVKRINVKAVLWKSLLYRQKAFEADIFGDCGHIFEARTAEK